MPHDAGDFKIPATSGLLDAALEIGHKRAAVLARMHQAVLDHDLERVFALAEQLTGFEPIGEEESLVQSGG